MPRPLPRRRSLHHPRLQTSITNVNRWSSQPLFLQRGVPPEILVAFVTLASVQLALRRLCKGVTPTPVQWEKSGALCCSRLAAIAHYVVIKNFSLPYSYSIARVFDCLSDLRMPNKKQTIPILASDAFYTW
jgi:hypothetical protein